MRTSTTLILLISLFAVSCGSEESPLDCGCNSPTVNTIPNEKLDNIPIEVQKMGVIFFKDDEIPDPFVPEEKFNNRFWIFQGSEGCYNCQRKFIVCNESFIGSEFDNLKQDKNSDSIAIKFTGDLKIMCGKELTIAPADFFYREIVLTSIEKMN
jgi:hypothetical protein